ncbi:CDP-glycerol glycerophosphotransferase family protein [Sphingomonas sp. LY54]|uniref:CDP-glycerol glycerophosphotransferase family protein n=1 Tax=Sphingomonas sp. LY54 TaxID=3095343 RepID=UPI002D78F466|nr:CDP-glycerol glycerophosphotransferase family protein [Sphingomonas sp. LY54]WRP28036.1 CDP-glycerol glycerophosphotransferase family protein [Sphingomonas sp. LY54]
MFLFVGEPHQLFHALPLAAELKVSGPDVDLEVAVASEGHLPMVEQVLAAYPGFDPPVRRLVAPRAEHGLRRLGIRGQLRIPTLLAALPYLRSFDAIVVPERTTTMMRHFLGRTKLVFTPHGAGDRAIMLDRRDRHFDFVLVAGEKSERRLLEAGTIRPGAYAVNGYVKMDFMRRLAAQRPRLFDNDRPTVLYAPHFRQPLSSWERFGREVIAAFAAQERYNLVVAPHVRLFHGASAKAKRAFEQLAVPGKIIVDLGSDRLVDMTYTSAADIYLGDVSSQVYEFLATPKPCVFLNAHGVDWESDSNYRFWTLGEVVEDPASILPAIDAAPARHGHYAGLQRCALAESVGGDPAGAARRGAEAIAAFLAGQRAPFDHAIREAVRAPSAFGSLAGENDASGEAHAA